MISLRAKLQYRGVFYEKKSNYVYKMGTSRPNGYNSYHSSVHAEIQAIKFFKTIEKNRKLNILIWRADKSGGIHPAYSCLCCSKYIIKNNLSEKVFTFDYNGKIVKAITDNPEVSKGMKIKWDKYNI